MISRVELVTFNAIELLSRLGVEPGDGTLSLMVDGEELVEADLENLSFVLKLDHSFDHEVDVIQMHRERH